MPDLTVLAACGYVAFGTLAGILLEERLWHLLSRPLPRPWRPVLRYLAPRELPGDIWRLLTTGRWTETTRGGPPTIRSAAAPFRPREP